MKTKLDSTVFTLWVNRGIALALTALLFLLPSLLNWYTSIRSLQAQEEMAITIAFYICAGIIYIALWQMDALLRSIRVGQVFTNRNVSRIRAVQWCCAGVSLVCLPAALIYYPLVFLVVIMGFLCLVVSVVCRVMAAAVAIREENDLTV